MYTIHTTPGFVVSSKPVGEAGKLLFIFTKNLGLIRATAQGIRFEKSKLRPFIQDYSRGIFSFVRGKEYWRLTNAQEMSGLDMSADKHETRELKLEDKKLVARIALLLNRLLQGEEEHVELFTTLDAFFSFLKNGSALELTENQFQVLESLVVTRILHRLGYVSVLPELKEVIETDNLSPDLLDELKDKRITMNQHINKALQESHL